MKKIVFLMAAVLTLSSCDSLFKKISNHDTATEDSLQNVIDQKENDLNDLMGTLNEIQEGFNQINEAQGRVNILNNNVEGGGTVQNIRENMTFIEETLEENRKKIEELQDKLNSSSVASAKLKSMVNNLAKQLESKGQEIEELRKQLAERDVKIEEMGNSISQLQDENAKVKEESETNAQIAQNQDIQLNTAWYVYGTSRELKDHNILSSGEVLQKHDFDKEYFTKIDIRQTNVISFGSKYAKILTTHPANSYTLLKDAKGEYTLRITDANKFWSVSKYLVVRVK